MAWGLGVLTGLLCLPRSSHGFGSFHLTSIPTLDALLAAAVAQLAARSALQQLHPERAAI
jgi:hypothetical protein